MKLDNETKRKWIVVFSSIALIMILGTILYTIARPHGHVFEEWILEASHERKTISFPLELTIRRTQSYRLSAFFPKVDYNVLVFPRFNIPVSIYLNGSLIFREADWHAQEDVWNPILSLPIDPTLIWNENRLVLVAENLNDPSVELLIIDPPYMSTIEQARWRSFWLKLLEHDFFVFTMGAIFFLGILLLFLSRESKEYRKAFSLIGISNLLACLFIAETVIPFLPVEPESLSIPILFYVFGITYSPYFAMAGVEHYHFGRLRLSRYVWWIPIVLIVVGILFSEIIMIVNMLALTYIVSLFMIAMVQSFRTKGTAFIFPFAFMLGATIFDLVGTFTPFTTFQLIRLQGYGLFGMSIGIALAVVGQYRKMVYDQQKTSEELNATYEELSAAHEELETSYQYLDTSIEKLEMIVKLSSQMVTASAVNRESFMSEALHMAMTLIPESSYGSVSLLENGKWQFVDAVGHDAKLLRSLDLTEEHFTPAQVFHNVKIYADHVSLIDQIMTQEKDHLPEGVLRDMSEATRPIKQTLLVDLMIGKQRFGQIALDIAQDSTHRFSDGAPKTLSAFGNMTSAFLALQQLSNMQEKIQKEIVFSIIQILEIHDSYTKGHSEHVANLSVDIARKMGFSEQEISQTYWAGMVHDIGKILVPQAILNKPSKLSALEFEVIQLHPTWGYEVLKDSEELKSIAKMVRYHHEKFDGTGYPEGVSGQDIPLVSRIIAVADAWDAMVRDRSYRRALTFEQAVQEITVNSGTQFDPAVVDAFLTIVEQEKEEWGGNR